MEQETFFTELQHFEPSNTLYHKWWSYALKMTKADILDIVRNGLTYQADGLVSMIKEITSGQQIPGSLQKKLKLLQLLCRKNASEMQ